MVHHAKVQKDIFGATILPQNLSFENAKKLSENQIKLQDIPLIDEDAAAECLAAEKIKAQTKRIPRLFTKREENVLEGADNVQVGASQAESYWSADPFENIPGPKLFFKFRGTTLKQVTQQIIVSTIYRIITKNEWETVRNSITEIPVESKEKYYDYFDEATEKLINRIKIIRNSQNEVPGNFLKELNKWSLECLCSIIFNKSVSFFENDVHIGGSLSSKTSQLFYSLNEATTNLYKLENGFQYWRFMNTTSLYSLGAACKVLESVISEYVAQLSPNDVVSRILDMLLIGMNTMSSALGFLFYHISTNPRVQVEVWSEIRKILPEKYTRLEYEHLSSFKYMQACLKESLRLKMPLPIYLRIISKNVSLSNFQIPRGTMILMTNQVECMKEDNFEEPEEFLPERWLEQGMNHPFTCFPLCNYFDDGMPRKLAELSIWICAINVFRHFTIDYMYDDIKATVSTVSFPTKPLKFTFTERFK
ncbi:cytochrome P450, putative [Pediculus humanus corporis]|uniref:Cytochrome P450, putative n=1 Tax=Pediculus humanus subsp. corporis TaxID=121224 RepID=E0VEB4_PEDHC|nr:cytochrome P450, putative [Pediculus humanus corporis]EEB11720.1 cytochrome P450, putative [Pediculus humanus corporis]